MKKSHVFFGLALLCLNSWGLYLYDANNPCYEIVQVKNLLLGEVLLDKCEGRTWALVQDKATLTQLGYVPDDGEDEEVDTIIWTRVPRGEGVVTFGGKEK